ncbi:MAG TPA: DUF6600 domain-containing protein, partial [Candidatus Aquicultoraceae bacterium]|nr:DUF6600 domain-containing protein [Candidatus Aquicultoraceae bacterium]
EGEGIVTAESGEIPVKAGEEAVIGEDVLVREYRGDGKDFREDLPPLTDAEREAGVPPAAAEELRDYGEWVYSQENGYVWRPRVSEGWSPYYYGQWYWVSPYGWTWLSYEPWGWYPYHYGYWYVDPFFGWVWWPYRSFVSVSFVFGHHHFDHFHGRAHFHPANVRFVRDGTRVRWIPLRPGERAGRISFTRSDRRLASWERPLERGTVFVRGDGRNGRGWRDWTAVRRERRNAAGISTSPARRDRGRVERIVPGEGTSGREPAVERDGRGRGERPGAITRERVPSPNRGQRISPPSSRPGGRSRSYPRENRLRPGIAERDGSPGRRVGVSPARTAVPDRAERYGIRGRGERYGDRGRERVRPSGPAVRQTGRNAFGANRQRVAAPRQGRTVTAPRGRPSVEASPGRGRIDGSFLGRDAARTAPPAIDRAGGRFRGSRSVPQGRSGGSFGRGLRFEGRGGFTGSGFRGGMRGRSVR